MFSVVSLPGTSPCQLCFFWCFAVSVGVVVACVRSAGVQGSGCASPLGFGRLPLQQLLLLWTLLCCTCNVDAVGLW